MIQAAKGFQRGTQFRVHSYEGFAEKASLSDASSVDVHEHVPGFSCMLKLHENLSSIDQEKPG